MKTSPINSPSTGRSRALLRNAWGVAGVLLALFVGGCKPADRTELRIATNPWAPCEFLYLAKERGFFAAEGLEVRLVEHASLSDCRVAFANGQVDAMTGSLVDVLQARENSPRSPQVALVTDYSNGADMILGRAELNSVADLKGRRVGIELGSLSVFMLARALERAGLKLNDVEMVSCAPDEMKAAMISGSVDAVVTYPPTSVGIEAGGQVRRLFSSAEIPGEVVDVLAVDAAWLQRDPSLPARLARVMQRALDEARAHPQAAYTFMGQREGLSGAEFEQALGGIQLVDAAGQQAFLGQRGSLQRSLQDVDRVLRETGQIHGTRSLAELLPTMETAGRKKEGP
jgi:NitT/TauT family transport system substrate-binding protein